MLTLCARCLSGAPSCVNGLSDDQRAEERNKLRLALATFALQLDAFEARLKIQRGQRQTPNSHHMMWVLLSLTHRWIRLVDCYDRGQSAALKTNQAPVSRGPFLYGTRRTSGRATIVGHIVTTVAAVELPTVVGGYCDTPSIA